MLSVTGEICDGKETANKDCCSSSNQCDINEGDCDYDHQCIGNLRCGRNNCPTGRKWDGDDSYDCCYDPALDNGGRSNYY